MSWLGLVPYNANLVRFVTHLTIANHLRCVGIIEIQAFCWDLVVTGGLPLIMDSNEDPKRMQMRPCGPEWEELKTILCSSETIGLFWDLDADGQVIYDTFGIRLIKRRSEWDFIPNSDRGLLHNQIQSADLQEAAGTTTHPSLAGYRGDPRAQTAPMKMRLDYELTNLINLGADEHAATLALDVNMKHDNGAGTDVRLVSIYNSLPRPSGNCRSGNDWAPTVTESSKRQKTW